MRMMTTTMMALALFLGACGGDKDGGEGDDCGVELASVYPADGATDVPVEDLVVVVELTADEGSASVDVLDPSGEVVWGNVDTTPIEVEFLYGDILPNTEYTIEMNMAPAMGELNCASATTTFTTGDAAR